VLDEQGRFVGGHDLVAQGGVADAVGVHGVSFGGRTRPPAGAVAAGGWRSIRQGRASRKATYIHRIHSQME